MEQGFKFVAADFTTRSRTFSYWDAARSGEWIEASNVDRGNNEPCPCREGDGLCVAHTVHAASLGGQPASTAVGLIVEYNDDDVLGRDDEKCRVSGLRVIGVFDPMHLIRLGLATDLREADLYRADLCGANLYEADLCGADLRWANLRGADPRGANLYEADLCGANLRGANLRGADLRGANLYEADLCGADLRGANLRGADLYEVLNLDTALNVPSHVTVPK